MFKYLVFLPVVFLVFQLVALFFGLASIGELFITVQLNIIIYEIRRCFWSEKDYIESEKILFRAKFWRK